MTLHHILLATLFSATLTAGAQGTTFTRNKVLLEKYTGIHCGWCPSGDRAVEGYLSRHPEHRDVMVEMRHNAYTTPDELTVPLHGALDAIWIPSGFPKYFVDRCSVDGNPSTSPRDYEISWDQFNTADFDPVSRRLSVPTHVSLSLDGSNYDPATRQLTVYAHGAVTADLPQLSINIYIVQDVMGYSGTSRATLTDIGGDHLPVLNGEYKVAYSATLPEQYGSIVARAADMHVVAFVSSRYTTDAHGTNDFTHSEVHNTDIVALTSLPAVSDIPDQCPSPTVRVADGQIILECSEPGAAFDYSIQPVDQQTEQPSLPVVGAASPTFAVTAKAGTPGKFPSAAVTYRFTLAELLSPSPSAAVTSVPHAADRGAVYDLTGRRATSSSAASSGTRLVLPGLHIVGGKKVVK